MHRSGFTLIEVALAAALMTFAVLTSLVIIPQGLKAQNHARMKAVAAAAVVQLFAETSGWDGTAAAGAFGGSLRPATDTPVSARVPDASGPLPDSPTDFYRLTTALAPGSDLASNVAFTFYPDPATTNSVNAIRAWEVRPVPGTGTFKAYYLATFTYFKP